MHLNILLTNLETKLEAQEDNIVKEAKMKDNYFKVILLENSQSVCTGCVYLHILRVYAH